jgi:hypothetical protein
VKLIPAYLFAVSDGGAPNITGAAFAGVGVTSIGAYAFAYFVGLTDITLPDGITAIAEGAFRNSGLTSVIIPDGVTDIGEYAFAGCSELTSLTIGGGVISIGSYAFAGSYSLITINYNAEQCADLTNVGDAFADAGKNGGGITVTVGAGVKLIPAYLFAVSGGAAPNITEVAFAEGGACADIGAYAFADLVGLTNITLPESVARIGARAFVDSGIWISAGDGLVYAGKWVVGYKGALTAAAFSDDTVVGIGDYAFDGYTASIGAIEFPAGLAYIGEGAFRGCIGLTDITLPTSLKTLGNYAFADCTALEYIAYDATACADLEADNNVFANAGRLSSGIRVIIGSGVKRIPSYLFYPAAGRTPKITLVFFEGGSVCESIGDYSFAYLSGLSISSISVPHSTQVSETAFVGTPLN